MWLLAALGTTVCFGINNTIFKWGTTKGLSKVSIQFFFYVVAFAVILSYSIVQEKLHFSLAAGLFGVIAGILNANGNIQMSKAFEKGPGGITSTLIAMNAIIPVLASGLVFPEPIAPLHWVGVILMISSAVIVQYQPSRSNAIEYRVWIFRILLALLSIGSVGFVMKLATIAGFSYTDLLVSFYGGGLCYLAVFMMKEEVRKTEMKVGSMVGLLSVVGFGCYLFALQSGPASVIFPVISLNCLVVMGLSLLLFHERLKSYQLVGVLVAVCGLVLTKI
ncbi:DMT family transporter [Ammoniphilus resinae]|uniref:Drug/metabolite transporter (DMT)-like permease n=1 Tax=Ammoniphilus resinae TaxID=861532 RepID=A0ABS4GXR4_9BACL|nr:DMT family transporter [Ammoniphilus resinae]MBP1935053.1 drug/metabolite transporter (DMT)-like permease [Ammoniphilus resinae]